MMASPHSIERAFLEKFLGLVGWLHQTSCPCRRQTKSGRAECATVRAQAVAKAWPTPLQKVSRDAKAPQPIPDHTTFLSIPHNDSPSMARVTKRAKVTHDSTAAYAASQPLFDALRHATERTSEQHALLSNARDVVQQTHVKLADAISDGDANQHARYIDCAVKAWRSATESYAEIFDALAKASAAEPSEGRGAREGHESFANMANMAAEANAMAKSFVLYGEQHASNAEGVTSQAVEANGESASEESEKEEEPDQDVTMESVPSDVITQSAISKDPKQKSKEAIHKKRIEDARQKHEKKLLALRAKMKNKSTQGPSKLSKVQNTNQVEYEDISGEVQARLKAKEAKREAAKKEKKRKRGSGDSFGADEPEPTSRGNIPKKKSKADIAAHDAEIVAVKEKRGKNARPAEEDAGAKKPKRLKTKA